VNTTPFLWRCDNVSEEEEEEDEEAAATSGSVWPDVFSFLVVRALSMAVVVVIVAILYHRVSKEICDYFKYIS